MAPKASKKKKTKEELEEERQAEEAARLAEEERLRQEEEDRRRLEELERQRVELLGQFLEAEGQRLDAERQDLEPLLRQYQHERAQALDARSQAASWERFLRCAHTPHPLERVQVNTFLARMAEASDTDDLHEAFVGCEDCRGMVLEARQELLAARLAGNDGWASTLAKDMQALYATINMRIDRATAHVLHHGDEFANERNEIQLGRVHGSFKWAVWVNTSKNPRLKQVEMPQVGAVVEIPKQIALANIALRLQHRLGGACDEFFVRATNEWMAVGGVVLPDLLALPPAAKKVRTWTLRQVTPLASNVQRVPYPIPPAGADPLTWQSEEDPPPLGITYPLPPDTLLLQGPLQAGWWDEATCSWSTAGISDVSYDPSSGLASFHTTHLAPLALLTSRCRLLPYASWYIRPTGGKNGSSAALTLSCKELDEKIVFEVTSTGVALKAPTWPQLASLVGVEMPPLELLTALSDRGLHLLPEDRDAPRAGVAAKDKATEEAMARDMALLGGVFLMASSKWNQSVAADEVLVRLSEVVDWEEGGRTQQGHAERIFAKEKEDGERRVLVAMRRGAKGVAFCDALDKRPELPKLPGTESVEALQACGESIFGEVHASMLTLLRGHFAAPGAADNLLALRLAALPESLEQVRTTNPLFTQTLADLVIALRMLSFS